MDNSICVKPVHKPNSKIFSIPNEHTLRCNDLLDPDYPHRHIAYTNTWYDLQKKTKQRDKKLDKPEIRKLCSTQDSEARYLWNSDPAKQGKEVFDSGEIKELNIECWKNSVIRVGPVLVRRRNGKPVVWSNGKWLDIESENKTLKKKIIEQDPDWDNPNWQIREQCGI